MGRAKGFQKNKRQGNRATTACAATEKFFKRTKDALGLGFFYSCFEW